jgi:hypothetical protein
MGHQRITDLAQSAAKTRPRTLPFLRIGSSDIGSLKGPPRQFRPSWVSRLRTRTRFSDNMASGEWRVAVGHQRITDLAQSVAKNRPRTLPSLRIGSSDIGLPKGRPKQFRPSWVSRLRTRTRFSDNMASGEWRVAVGHQGITDLAQSAAKSHPRTLPFLRIGSSDIGLLKDPPRQFRPSWVSRLGT